MLGVGYVGLNKTDMVISLMEQTDIIQAIIIILEILRGHHQRGESNLFQMVSEAISAETDI